MHFFVTINDLSIVDKESELIKLGELVRSTRVSKKMTQAELAHTIGKDQQSIQRLEKGKVNPSYIYLLEIAEGLEISVFELFKID